MTNIVEMNVAEGKDNSCSISEKIAHQIIEGRDSVMMVFKRPDDTYYGYKATRITDLNHAKKMQLNEFIRFEKKVK